MQQLVKQNSRKEENKMNKNYVEPEFKVVVTNCEDILTTSGEGGSNHLNRAGGWEAFGSNGVPFIEL